MRRFILCFFALATLSLAGCDPRGAIESWAPKDQAAAGQRYLEDVRLGHYDDLIAAYNPAKRPPNMLDLLKQMTGAFPKEEPRSIHVISFGSRTDNGRQTLFLNYEYVYAHGAILGNVNLSPKSKGFVLEGIHIQVVSQSAVQARAFTLEGKSAYHVITLFCAIIFPIFCIVTAVAVWRTRLARPRWLWMIFVLLGFVSVTLNWSTGEFFIAPIGFVFLGAAFNKPLYGDLMLQIAIPLGAILFWIFLPRWRQKAKAAAADAFGPNADMRGPPS